MLCKCLHLFTALGCLQTARVLCQSAELADTWSESCAATLARCCPQTDTVCPFLPPLGSEMETQCGGNLLGSCWTIALGSTSPGKTHLLPWPEHDHGLPVSQALPKGSKRVLQKLPFDMPEAAVWGRSCSLPWWEPCSQCRSFLWRQSKKKLGAVVRWTLEAHCVLHFSSPKLPCSFWVSLGLCRALRGYLQGEDLEGQAGVLFPAEHPLFPLPFAGQGEAGAGPSSEVLPLEVQRF